MKQNSSSTCSGSRSTTGLPAAGPSLRVFDLPGQLFMPFGEHTNEGCTPTPEEGRGPGDRAVVVVPRTGTETPPLLDSEIVCDDQDVTGPEPLDVEPIGLDNLPILSFLRLEDLDQEATANHWTVAEEVGLLIGAMRSGPHIGDRLRAQQAWRRWLTQAAVLSGYIREQTKQLTIRDDETQRARLVQSERVKQLASRALTSIHPARALPTVGDQNEQTNSSADSASGNPRADRPVGQVGAGGRGPDSGLDAELPDVSATGPLPTGRLLVGER